METFVLVEAQYEVERLHLREGEIRRCHLAGLEGLTWREGKEGFITKVLTTKINIFFVPTNFTKVFLPYLG